MDGLQLLVIFTVLGINSVTGAETCGEKQYFVAEEEFALFTSPNYPDFYPSNLKCEWWVLTPYYENDIYLQFSFLDIEDSDNCENDRLTIYQIYHGQEKVVDICGNSTSDNMLKLGSDIRITFQSNNDTEGRGFVIQYFMVEDEKRDDDDSQSRGYTNHWGSMLIIVFAIAVVALLVTTIVVCYCTRKRIKQQQKQEVYTVAYKSSNDDGDDNEYNDKKENDV